MSGPSNPGLADWDSLEFRQFLANGSFGWVFNTVQSYNPNLPSNVAAKILFLAKAEESCKLQREYGNVKHHKHENLVESYDFVKMTKTAKAYSPKEAFTRDEEPLKKQFVDSVRSSWPKRTGGIYCLILELCDMTLQNALDEKLVQNLTYLNASSQFKVMNGLLEGLRYLHRNNVIHRDLKPDNIFLKGDWIVKIGDFGTSRLLKKNEEWTQNVGSVMYQAPEARNPGYGTEVDIFPLGLIFWEIHLPSAHRSMREELFNKLRRGETVEVEHHPVITNLRDTIINFVTLPAMDRIAYFQTLQLEPCFKSDWKTAWQLLQGLTSIVAIGQVPHNFTDRFRKSISKSQGIKNDLSNAMLAEVMDTAEQQPEKQWTLKEVLRIYTIFRDYMTRRGKAVELHPKYRAISDLLPKMSYNEFVLVSKLIDEPVGRREGDLFSNLLPYLLQSIKMSNRATFTTKFVSSLTTNVFYLRGSKRPTEWREGLVPVTEGRRCSRLDIMVAFFNCLQDELGFEVSRIWGSFNISFPLVLPDLRKESAGSFLLTAPWLTSVMVRTGNKEGTIMENYMFRSPYKLVIALRIGESNGDESKSTLLNRLLSQENIFSSSLESGFAAGLPSCLEGCMELLRLSPTNCGDALAEAMNASVQGNEILLLANLHGNAKEYTDIVEGLGNLVSGCLVFDFREKDPRTVRMFIGDSQSCRNLIVKDLMPQEFEWLAISPFHDDSKKQLADLIGKTFRTSPFGEPFLSHKFKNTKRFQIVKDRTHRSSKNFLTYLSSFPNYADIKAQLTLQKNTGNDLEQPISWEEYQGNKIALSIIEQLVAILELPIEERKQAIRHIEMEMSYQTCLKTRDLLSRSLQLKQDRTKEVGLMQNRSDVVIVSEHLVELENEIKMISIALDERNFGLEHLFREMGSFYEFALKERKQMDRISITIPGAMRRLAELFSEGQAIELVDGDRGNINGKWINATLSYVLKIKRNMNVFIVSIIGLQSSGKSTLLNSLFGCSFPVSPGRCTRGLFIRILFLDDPLKAEVNCDAIVLIDTEGMCAPEKYLDPHSAQRDREMATFAMLISNITLINIQGETMKDMTDILQIVVVTMARLEKVTATPDFLLVQHCSMKDRNNLQATSAEFCRAIEKAIKLTKEECAVLGTIYSPSHSKLWERVTRNELLHLFHPYRAGPEPDSPPNPGYTADVKALFQTLVKHMKDSKCKEDFGRWCNLLVPYWEVLRKENFAVTFTTLQDIQSFIERSRCLGNVTLLIEESINTHRKFYKTAIRIKLLRQGCLDEAELKEGIFEKLQRKTLGACDWKTIPQLANKCSCPEFLQKYVSLLRMVSGGDAENEVKATFKSCQENARKRAEEQLDAYITQQLSHLKDFIKFRTLLHQEYEQNKNKLDHYNGYDLHSQIRYKKWVLDRVDDHNFMSSSITMDLSVEQQFLLDIEKTYTLTPVVKRLAEIRNTAQLERLRQEAEPVAQNSKDGLLSRFNFFQSKAKVTVSKKVSERHSVNGLTQEQMNNIAKDVPEIASRVLLSFEEYSEPHVMKFKNYIDSYIRSNGYQRGKVVEQWLPENVQWNIHMYGLQVFNTHYRKLYYKHKAKENVSYSRPLMLKNVETVLERGIGIATDGAQLANCVLLAFQQKAKKAVEQSVKNTLLAERWITNVESVRQAFLVDLLEDVGNELCLEYAEDPSSALKRWFEEKVGEFDQDDSNSSKALSIFNNEIDDLYTSMKRKERAGFQPVLDACVEYLAEANGIFYSCQQSIYFSDQEFYQFMHGFWNQMKSKSKVEFDSIKFKRCVDSTAVKEKLGCLESCAWCGALCWGTHSHSKNMGATRLHHTYHQPMGMQGFIDTENNWLTQCSCDMARWNDKEGFVKRIGTNVPVSLKTLNGTDELQDWFRITQERSDCSDILQFIFQKLQASLVKKFKIRSDGPDISATCDSERQKAVLANLKLKIDNSI